jgi:hypothetical protein
VGRGGEGEEETGVAVFFVEEAFFRESGGGGAGMVAGGRGLSSDDGPVSDSLLHHECPYDVLRKRYRI